MQLMSDPRAIRGFIEDDSAVVWICKQMCSMLEDIWICALSLEARFGTSLKIFL
jgi:hypothetical protein